MLLLLQLGVVTVTGQEAQDILADRPVEQEEGHHPAEHPALAGGRAGAPQEEPHTGKVAAVQEVDPNPLEVPIVTIEGEVGADPEADQHPEVAPSL